MRGRQYSERMRRRLAPVAATAALIAMLRRLGFSMVDCQQSTGHLASLGAREISRNEFLARIGELCALPGPDWSKVRIEWPE